MELHYLQEFVTLERIRNYTHAADALYTTEATLSRHIKSLEKELGEPLFVRTTRKIELTEFGIKFLIYAEKLVQTMQECEENLLNRELEPVNRLIVGVFGQTANYPVIRDALSLFAANNSNCAIGTVQGDIIQLKEKLHRRECNLSIVRERDPVADDMFDRLPLLLEPLCVVVPKDDPISREETVDIAKLRGKNITLPSEHMLAHKLFFELCRAEGFEPRVTLILKEREFMESFMTLGSGITVLCRNMAERSANPETQVVKEISPQTCEYVNVLTLKGVKLPEITQNALQCFEEAVRKAR